MRWFAAMQARPAVQRSDKMAVEIRARMTRQPRARLRSACTTPRTTPRDWRARRRADEGRSRRGPGPGAPGLSRKHPRGLTPPLGGGPERETQSCRWVIGGRAHRDDSNTRDVRLRAAKFRALRVQPATRRGSAHLLQNRHAHHQ
jgi:hypothetical protein